MDAIVVKSEVNSNGRRAASPSDGSEAVRCVKRRRREPTLLPSTATNANGAVLDQSTTTTSTIKRSSRFRGVSRHRWTGRFEAHLWDKASWNATQRKKGKQVYLGAYDEEESAARAYDLAALKYWGPTTFINFPVTDYEKELQIMQEVTKEEYLASLRRKSSGFSRGVSRYRGVARHHHNGRWEARIGRIFGNKYLYLGTYSTQEEAAHAYDIAAIEYRGINAVTNFDLSSYIRWLRPGPGATNALNGSNEQQPNGEPRTTQPTSNLFLTSEVEIEPLPHRNPFINVDIDPPCKQEYVSHQTPVSSSKSSSPTALGLLLRSSMFKQLVEKNSNAPNEEIYGEETKDRGQLQVGGDEEYRGFFYAGMASVPFISTSNGENEPRIEQPLWNGVISLPSVQ